MSTNYEAMAMSEFEMRKELALLRESHDGLLDALQRLYDASPASCEDSALIEAQILAESLLGIKKASPALRQQEVDRGNAAVGPDYAEEA